MTRVWWKLSILCALMVMSSVPAAGQWDEREPPSEPAWLRTINDPAFLPTLGGALLGMGAGFGLGAAVGGESAPVWGGVLGSTAGTTVGVWHGTGRTQHWAKQAVISTFGGVVGGALGCLAGHFTLGLLIQKGTEVEIGCAAGFSVGQAYATVQMQEVFIGEPE